MRSTVMTATLAAVGACTLVAIAAQAQTQASAAGTEELAEITITGSRVIANGNDAPTPVTVITPEQVMAAKPTTVYENLIDLPVFSGSRGAANSAVGNGPNGQNAVSTLNLRNMGANRSLVLFDGHRVPPSTPDGLVDVSALPQLLIQRVDVVTGGASAVYGSDAVTGVTNFITDSKFNGWKVNLQRGVSAHNDDKSYQVGIAFGHDLFGGSGHFEASYERNKDDGLYDDQRRWADPRWTVLGNGGSIPWHLVSYATNASASFGGAIACPNLPPISPSCPPANINGQTVFPLVGQTFNQNGVLSTFNPGLRGAANGLGSPATQIGGDGVIFDNVAVKSAVRTDQVFARFDYDFTDNIHGYISGSGNASYVAGNTGVQRTFPPGWRLGACNAFLTAAYQTALGCTPANNGTAAEPIFFFEKAFDPLTNYGYGQNNRLFTHDYFVIADLAGKFGDGYHWDATYTHSQSILDIRAKNQNYTHQYAGLDAVKDSSGNIVCKVTLTNPGLIPGCVPLNMFGPTAMTADMVNYLADEITNRTQNKLDGFSGSLTGPPLNSWAGPIDMALSVELRKLTMDLSTTSLPTDFINCTGMRFGNCVQGSTLLHNNSWLPVSGANQTVSEGAYEFNLPLMKDASLAKNLSFNGAARYTKYKDDPNDPTIVSRSFSAVTWKAGLVWDVTDQLTLRWARSRDIRAPTLYDLYLPQTVGNGTFAFDYLLKDPVTGLPGQQLNVIPISGGNPYLDPEVAHTSTLGIIYRPTSQLSLSVDAYRIDLLKVLYSLNGANQTVQQACYDSGGASPICQLQLRPNGCCSDASQANHVTAFYTRLVNIAEQKTSGIDFEANFNTQMLNRALSLRALVTYQPHILYVLPLAPVVYDTAGVAYPGIGGNPAPVWKGALYAAYKVTDSLTVDASERYRSRLGWTEDPRQTQVGGVGSVAYTNLTVDYRLPIEAAQASVFLNVQNLFDKAPPPASPQNGTFPGSTPGVYAIGDDVVGAYYTLGVRLRL
jgi:iron complex outermembrane receptor protein